jgi:hypothetical protein
MDPLSIAAAGGAVISYVDHALKIIGRAAELQQSPVRLSYWLVAADQALNTLLAGIKELEALTAYLLPICIVDQRLRSFFEEIALSVAELRPIVEEVYSNINLNVWRSPIRVLGTRWKLGSLQDRLSKLSERLSDSL